MELIDGMIEAYYDCLRHKRGTISAMNFSLNWMAEIAALTESVESMTYRPSTSIVFAVTRPRLREVFAANFRDRVVHHYIALRLEPLFEEVFSNRTYNCRKEKGQLYGVRHLKQDIEECSEDYTKECWIMKVDLKGFFMSIDKRLLADIIDKFIIERYEGEDKGILLYLCRTVIIHEPQLDCVVKGNPKLLDQLPDHKTLFRNERGKGIAIGNLFAQIFANFYLNEIDWFIHRITPYHGRYVDDIYMISCDKQLLLDLVPKLRAELTRLGLRLNESKFYFQEAKKGVKFTGMVVKPHRTYSANRTVGGFVNSVRKLNRSYTIYEINHAVQSLNSYLGFLRQHNEYAMRVKYLKMIEPRLYEYIYIKGHYEVVVIKRQYRL